MKDLLPRQTEKLLLSAITDDNMGAGLQYSGTSGSGKSRLLVWTVFKFLQLGVPGLFLDPHGDAADLLRRVALTLPRRKREKIWFWQPANPRVTASINPYYFREEGLTDYQRSARLRVHSELFWNVILSDYGETEFGSRTHLRKHGMRTGLICGESRLPPALSTMLIDPQSPVYPLLCQLAPDDMARYQMEMIAAMRPADQEGEIGSTRNRLMSTLDHPASKMLFSRWDNVIDFEYLYENDITLIVDLSKLGLLTDNVQQLIANTVLLCMQSVVMAKPQSHRRPRFAALDELPLFASSFPLLQTQCTEIRKFLTKFVFCHQGSARFPDRHDNEFLNTLTDMCRVHVYFRHGASDAEFFGRQVSLADWKNKKKIKHVQKTPMEFSDGFRVITLRDYSTSNGKTDGSSAMDGSTDQITEALQTAAETGRRMSNSQGSVKANQHTNTTMGSTTISSSETIKQTIIPRTKLKNIVTGLQFYGVDELDREDAAAMRNYQTREACLVIDGMATYKIRSPKLVDPYLMTPCYCQRKLDEWFQRQVANRPEFTTPEQLEKDRQDFVNALITNLRDMAYRRQNSIEASTPANDSSTLLLPTTAQDSPIIVPSQDAIAPSPIVSPETDDQLWFN
jgi:hypothetical protein